MTAGLNPAGDRARNVQSSPGYTSAQREEMAERAAQDAVSLVVDVRSFDPREFWGRLTAMSARDPQRLVAVAVALAAMVDPTTRTSQLLAWTDTLTQRVA